MEWYPILHIRHRVLCNAYVCVQALDWLYLRGRFGLLALSQSVGVHSSPHTLGGHGCVAQGTQHCFGLFSRCNSCRLLWLVRTKSHYWYWLHKAGTPRIQQFVPCLLLLSNGILEMNRMNKLRVWRHGGEANMEPFVTVSGPSHTGGLRIP